MLFDFKGTATRAEWWGSSILYAVIAGIFRLMLVYLEETGVIFLIVIGILQIVIGILQLAVSVRRMHDMDKSGWWLLVPIYAWILLAFVPGTSGSGSGSGSGRSTNLSSVSSVVSSSTEETKRCEKCGARVSASELKCPKCGGESFL